MSAAEPELIDMRWWHIEQLVQIEQQVFGVEAWSAGMFWSELAAGHGYRLAMEGELVLGYAGLAVVDCDAWVNNLAVRPQARRRGLGERLLRDLVDRAVSAGALRLLLEVAVDNAPAQRLYERFGFEQVGLRRGYYQPSNTDALVMRRELEESSDR